MIDNPTRIRDPHKAAAFLDNLGLVMDAPPLNTYDAAVSAQLFAPNVPDITKQAHHDYYNNVQVVGEDGNTYTYGASVRTLDLRGKTPDELHHELIEKGFEPHLDEIIRLRNGDPVEVDGRQFQQLVYTHQDGGMVRIKPEGDPLNDKRPQPHSSKSVRYPPHETYKIFDYEAFKVTNNGNAVPKEPFDLKNPLPPTNAAEGAYLDYIMDLAHTDLPTERHP